MSKKLLSEAQVRRFMGLAGINPLNEMAYKEDDKEMREGEELDEMRHSMKKDDEMREMRGDMKKDNKDLTEEEEPEMDMAMDDEDDMDMDDKADDEIDAEVEESDVMKGIQGLKDGLKVLEDIASSAGLAAGDDEPDMAMDDEDEMDMEDEVEMKDEEDEMDMMEAELAEVNMELTEEEIVNEVARRVAKRIVEAKRAHKKMNEALGRKK